MITCILRHLNLAPFHLPLPQPICAKKRSTGLPKPTRHEWSWGRCVCSRGVSYLCRAFEIPFEIFPLEITLPEKSIR